MPQARNRSWLRHRQWLRIRATRFPDSEVMGWVTEYLHVLRGEDSVVQWAMGTRLRPYLDVLGPDDRIGFLTAYAEALRPHYPPQTDGSVLLPFRRLFVLAKN